MGQTRLTFEYNFPFGELEVALRQELWIRVFLETDEDNTKKAIWRIDSSEDAKRVLNWLTEREGVSNMKVEHPSP